MSAPTYEDANIMLQLSRLGAEQGNSRAARFIWSDKFIEDFAEFEKNFPQGTKEYQYATRICGWYETVGALWVNGLINEKLLSDWLAVGLVWQRVEGFALGVREKVGEPKIYEHFEALAKKLS